MARETHKISGEEHADLSEVGTILREIDDDFSITKYGYSKTAGFKKIIEDLVKKKVLNYKMSDRSTIKDHFNLSISESGFESLKPSNYDLIVDKGILRKQSTVFKKNLRDEGYYYYIDNIVQLSSHISSMFDKTSVFNFDEIYEYAIHITQNMNTEIIMSQIKTLFDSGCFIDKEMNQVINRGEKVIFDIRSSQQIETHILTFIQEKLVQYNNGNPVETRILKFIIYAEI